MDGNNESNRASNGTDQSTGRHVHVPHSCWYCGHNGGDPVKTAQMKANGNFLLGITAALLGILCFKVK